MPLQAPVAYCRFGAQRVEANAGQRRLQGGLALQISEEAVTFVSVDQANCALGPRQRAPGDEPFEHLGNFHAQGHARGVVHRTRLGTVGDGPHLVLRIASAAHHAADHVVVADVFAHIHLGVQSQGPVLVQQAAQLAALVV